MYYLYVETSDDFLQSMQHFNKSLNTLKSIVSNSTSIQNDVKYGELFAKRSLFLGYCWSDYNDIAAAIVRIREK